MKSFNIECFYVITNTKKDPDYAFTRKLKDFLFLNGRKCIQVPTEADVDMKRMTAKLDPEKDCLLVIGGDGSVLRAAHQVLGTGIPILGINFGGNAGMILLTTTIGNLMGLSLGYMVSHIGHFSYKKKDTILTIITLGGGAISGLYAIQLKAVVEAKAPIINRINPMSVITDAFYSLNIFGTGDRYLRAILTMIGLSVIFFIVGVLLGRRNQYESL